MSETALRALIAGHGDFAAGLISAVEAITGRGDVFIGIQVRDLCSDDIQQLLRDRLRESGAQVIFTDLSAGSCTMAARKVLRDMPGAVLVAGVNLPMLLEFCFSTNPSGPEAAAAAAEKGRQSVSVHGGAA